MATAAAVATVELTLIDRISAPIKRIQARLAAMSKALGFERIAAASKNLGRQIVNLGDGLARTTGRLSSFIGLLGLGSAGAIAGAFGLAKSASDIGSEILDTSYKLGIGAEALQEYRWAAKAAGVDSETLGKGIEKLGINAVLAAKGNKGLAADFKSLGVKLKGPKGQMRGMEAILNDTVGALARIKDPLARNAIAFRIFGKSGVELTKMLADGAEGFARSREEARRLGSVMSERAAEAAKQLGDNIDGLVERLRGIKLMIGVHLLPVMNEMIKNLTGWIDANKGLVRQNIAEWVKKFSDVLRDLMNPSSEIRKKISDLASGFASFLEKIKPVVDFIGGPLVGALGLAAAWIVGPMVAALAVLTLAFVQFGAVILTTPFGWILAGVAAVAACVYVLYQKWDEFVAYWVGLWGRVTDSFDQGFIQGVTTLLMELNPVTHIARGMDAVLEYFTGFSLIDAGSKIAASLGDGIAAGGLVIWRWIDGLMTKFENFGLELGDKLYFAGSAVVNSFLDGLKATWGGVVEWFQSSINGLIGWLPESLQRKLGFEPGATVSPPSAPSVASPVSAPSVPAPISLPAVNAAPAPMRADSVNAGTVQAQTLEIPEPITISRPQQVNAPLNVGGITIYAQSNDPREIAAAVDNVLAKRSAAHAANIQSSLSD